MIIDIVTAAVFLLCIILGAKKGFAKTVMGLCTYLVSFIIGLIFYDRFYKNICLIPVIGDKIDSLRAAITEAISNKIVSEGVEGLPVFLKYGIDEYTNNIASGLGDKITEALVAILFIVLIILLIKLLLWLICLIVKLPVLKQFNKILGGAVGAINGIIVCYIAGAVILFLLVLFGNASIGKMLDGSVTGQYLYKNNVILNLLLGF